MPSLSAKKQEEYRRVFDEFDEDKSGSIETSEIKALMTRLGHTPTDAEVSDYIKEFDADGNGSIDFSEFCVMMTRVSDGPSAAEVTRESFKTIDRDGDLFISRADLVAALAEADILGITGDVIDAMFAEADLNGDGKIDMGEFQNIIKQVDAM